MTGRKYEDIEGQCNARLILGDDFGDNHCTFRCQLEPDHSGQHQEKHNQGDDEDPNWVVVQWDNDHTIVCEKHGRVAKFDGQCEQCYNENHPEPKVPYIDDYMNDFRFPALGFATRLNGFIEILEVKYNRENAELACGKELSYYDYNYIKYIMEHHNEVMLWYELPPHGVLEEMELSFIDPGQVSMVSGDGDNVFIKHIVARIRKKNG
jgi:hypothetical protein